MPTLPSDLPSTYAGRAALFLQNLIAKGEKRPDWTFYLSNPNRAAVICHQQPLTREQDNLLYQRLNPEGGLGLSPYFGQVARVILANQTDQITDTVTGAIQHIVSHVDSGGTHPRAALIVGMQTSSGLPDVIVTAVRHNRKHPWGVNLELAFAITCQEFDADALATQSQYASAFIATASCPTDIILNGLTLHDFIVPPGAGANKIMMLYQRELELERTRHANRARKN